MVNAGASIEALLTLDASGFDSGIQSSIQAINKFKNALISFSTSSQKISTGLEEFRQHLKAVNNAITELNFVTKKVDAFNSLANGVKKLADGLKILGGDLGNTQQAMRLIAGSFQSFKRSLDGTEIKISGIKTALREIVASQNQTSQSTQRVAQATRQYYQGLTSLTKAMTQYKLGATDVQQSIRSSVSAFNSQYMSFEKVNEKAILSRQALKLYRSELMQLALGVETFNSVASQNTARLRENQGALEQVIQSDNRVRASKQQVASATNQATSSTSREASAHDKATQSINRQATASKGLGRALSSLRMMGTMVGSMIAYNFVHNLAMATTETINAKSEMNGYFQMLGYTTRQTEDFNKALDNTVAKFPRLNKYALGETISSIGVEFELTTKEMKKAMPVVSMITSEYLRAGRNVNEASLAVKDILQGEFQRLSRETGVKAKDLKEAGWSGDKTDVMGLLEALDKVGKARNWDTFVQKANSLNDAVLILQNRFSEWSADMVERVQPTILGVFNALMDVGGKIAPIFNGILNWLGGNSWTASAVKIGAVAIALRNLLTAIVSVRTGANLLQISQMGLLRSIGATILGLNAEAVATNGVRGALAMKLTGLTAEKVAEIGSTQAIYGHILGLKAEEVAENGLVGAINKNIISREAETVATVENSGANIGFLGSLTAVITGEEIATGTTLTLSEALGVLTAEMLMSPIGIFIASLTALAGAFYIATGGLDEHWAKMQQFNDILENSDDIVKEHETYLKNLGETVGTSSDEYLTAKSKIEEFNKELGSSKALVEKYKSEVSSIDISISTSLELNSKYAGLSQENIDELSKYVSSLNEGYNTYYRALQVIHKQESDFDKSDRTLLANMKERGAEEKEILSKREEHSKHYSDFMKHSAEHNTSEDWWGGTWAGMLAGLDSFQIWLDYKTEDIAKSWHDTNEELDRMVDGFGKWIGDSWKHTGEMWKDWVNDVGTSISDSWQSLTEMWDNNIKNPIMNWWNGFISFDWLPKIDIWGTLMSWIFPDPVSASDGSSDHPSFMQDISNILGFDIQSWITNFNTDPLGTLGIQLPQIDIIGLITSLIPIGGEGGFDIGAWLGSIFNIDGIVASFTSNLNIIFTTASTIASNVSGVFNNLKNMIWGHIQGILSNVTSTFTNIKNVAVNQVNGLSSGIKSGIDKVVGAFNYMKNAILNSAKAIYDGVKSKFDSVKNTIGDFWHNLTNPSSWGSAGSESYQRRSPKPQTARRMFSPVIRSAVHHGAGVNPYKDDSQSVKLKDLMSIVDGDNKVRLSDFLSMFTEGGFGAWDFHEPVKKRVFDTAKNYKTGSPSIQGIGTVGDGYEVRKFWNGKPSFSFDEFQAVAQAIFSAIPYKFYYDSEWKGNWVNALLSGAVNCSDGADALIALARVFGFDGYKQHTTLKNGVGHFFAVIGGKAMDTTNFQNHGSWSPLGGAGIPTRTSTSARTGRVDTGKTVNITVDMQGATVYGVEDLDSRIEDSVKRGLREEFNDPYTIAI